VKAGSYLFGGSEVAGTEVAAGPEAAAAGTEDAAAGTEVAAAGTKIAATEGAAESVGLFGEIGSSLLEGLEFLPLLLF
jgi:hypothetical protein